MAQKSITIEGLPGWLITICLECGLVKVPIESIERTERHRTIYSHPCYICQEKQSRQEEEDAEEWIKKLWDEIIPNAFKCICY